MLSAIALPFTSLNSFDLRFIMHFAPPRAHIIHNGIRDQHQQIEMPENKSRENPLSTESKQEKSHNKSAR